MSHSTETATLFVVCGLPGSGKTTHAKKIEAELGAVRFCPDEWMEELEIDLWHSDTRERIEQLQWKLAQTLLRLRQSVIIEWGTWGRSERDKVRLEARVIGARVELHFLDAPVNVLFQRIRKRNRETPPIELADMQQWSDVIERPTPDEMALFD
jgi:predicted kinase